MASARPKDGGPLSGQPEEDVYVPMPRDRKYYRNTVTGDRAFAILKNDQTYLRMDRGGDGAAQTGYHDRRFTNKEQKVWKREADFRPMQDYQRGMVCYAADLALKRVLGQSSDDEGEWNVIKPELRRAYIEEGPKRNPYRAAVWKAVNEAIRKVDDEQSRRAKS